MAKVAMTKEQETNWRAEKHSYSRTFSAIKGEPIKVLDIEPSQQGQLGYTSARKTIHLAYDHEHFDGLDPKGKQTCRRGIAAHELLHQLITDFVIENRALVTLSNVHKEILGMIMNYVEDARIEHFAYQFIGGTLLSSLEFAIAHTYNKTPKLQEGKNAFEQFTLALQQFGDMGMLKGRFTFPEAAEAFKKSVPLYDKAIHETNPRKVVKYSKEIFEISKPLWKDMDDLEKAIRKMMEEENKRGRSGRGDGGKASHEASDEDGDGDGKGARRKMTMREVSRKEYNDLMKNSSGSGKGGSGGDMEIIKCKDAKTAEEAAEAAQEAQEWANDAKDAAADAQAAANEAKGSSNESNAQKAADRTSAAAERAQKAADTAKAEAEASKDAKDKGDEAGEENHAKAAGRAALNAAAAARSADKADQEANGKDSGGSSAETAQDAQECASAAQEAANEAKSAAEKAEAEAEAAEAEAKSSGSEEANKEAEAARKKAERAKAAAEKAQEAANEAKAFAEAAEAAQEAENEAGESTNARNAEKAMKKAQSEAKKAMGSSSKHTPGEKANDAQLFDYSQLEGETSNTDSEVTDRAINGARPDYSNCGDELSDPEYDNTPPEFTFEDYVLTDDDFASIETEIESCIEALKREEIADGEDKSPLPDFEITSARIGRAKTCLNRRITVDDPERAAELYAKLVANLNDGINSLTGRLKNIFQNDLEEKSYRASGKLNYKRVNSGRLTARVFDKNKLPSEKSEAAVMILVDESGSMSGRNAETAKQTAIALAEVFGNLHVPVYIIGFTADTSGHDAVHNHYVTWKNTRKERLRLLDITARCNNFDGYSIRYGGKILEKCNAKHKLMIVVSDGSPACSAYRGADGIADTKDAIRSVRKFADVLGVLIGPYSVEDLQNMYGNDFINVTRVNELFAQLAKRVVKIVNRWD